MNQAGVNSEPLSEFMGFLAHTKGNFPEKLPSLNELSQTLSISISSLREQLEVAKALGLVEVRPKTGIRRLNYQFRPSVIQSLRYAVAVSDSNFKAFADLRNHIEAVYWIDAVKLLKSEDHEYLLDLIKSAKEKLYRKTVQIPQHEHRELHLAIYRRLDNPFVIGLLESYWQMYEIVGLDVFTDLSYLERVWQYHESMVNNIIEGNHKAGYKALIDHLDLIFQRTKPVFPHQFE